MNVKSFFNNTIKSFNITVHKIVAKKEKMVKFIQ